MRSLRFWLVDVLPTLLLLGFGLALMVSGAPANVPRPGRVLGAIDRLNLQRACILLVIAAALGVVLHPFQFSLVRILEGYWHQFRVGRFLARTAVRRQRRRRARLEAVARGEAHSEAERQRKVLATARLLTYPADARVLPTRLGNAMRAAEDEAGQRYGFDTISMLPRLYPQLSDAMRQMLVDARNQLDATTRMCAVLLVAAGLSALALARHGWWLLVPATTALLAWLAYRAAVRAAVNWGQGLFLAFDLHRFEMLRALHLPLPTDQRRERELNRQATRFLVTGRPSDISYDHASRDGREVPPPAPAR